MARQIKLVWMVAAIFLLMGGIISNVSKVSAAPTSPRGISSIGDLVWHDNNGNGQYNTGELGINGVQVRLWFDKNNDNQLNPALDEIYKPSASATYTNPLTTAATTGAIPDGFYRFNEVTFPGTYFVEILASNFEPGQPLHNKIYTGSGPGTSNVFQQNGAVIYRVAELSFQSDRVDADFGFANASILVVKTAASAPDGATFNTAPGTPVQFTYTYTNTGQTPLTNIVVRDDNSTPGNLGDDFTVACASFQFPSAPMLPGQSATCTHTLSIHANHVNSALATAKPSDPDGFPLPLAPTVQDTDDAKVVVSAGAQLGDRVWEDKNGNGIQDVGEPNIDNVTVHLFKTSDLNNPFKTTTTTGGGKYSFTNLDAGNYVVEFVKPVGHSITKTKAGGDDVIDSDPAPTTGRTATITLAAGEVNNKIDAGLYRPASLGDRVWEDRNGNGVQDGGEPGINGVTVNLRDNTGVVSTTVTSNGGLYHFQNLAPGTYQVEFTEPGGYTFTGQNVGDDASDSDANPADGLVSFVTLQSGDTIDTIDAGMYRPVSVGDRVWDDLNGNGVQDPGEPSLNGASVSLLDGNGNPLANTTVVNGVYSFANLAPGTYQVQFFLLPGYQYTKLDATIDSADSDADQTTGKSPQITLESGQQVDTVDAGMVKPGSIGDFVWHNLNEDGIQNPGELGLDGVTVQLFRQGDTLPFRTTTTAPNGGQSGYYNFDNLIPGNYFIKFLAPNGFFFSPQGQGGDIAKDSDANASSGQTGIIELASGQIIDTIDAGLSKPTNTPTPTMTSATATPTSLTTSTSTPTASHTPTASQTPTPAQTPTPTHTTVPGQPSLSITKRLIASGPASNGIVVVGQNFSYVITVINTGSKVLTTVPLVDSYDTQFLGFVDALPAQDLSNSGGSLIWNDITGNGVLNPNESKLIVVNFVAKKSTDRQPNKQTLNVAVVSGARDVDGITLADKKDEAPIRITDPQVGISKRTASPANGIVGVGDAVVFTIRITNRGDTTLVKIPVKDLFEADILQFVSTNIRAPQVTIIGTGGELFWSDISADLGAIAPGASVQFDVTFRLKAAKKTTNFVETGTTTDENGDTVPPVAGASGANVEPSAPGITNLYLPVLKGNVPTPTPTGIVGGEGEPQCPPAGCPVVGLIHPKGIAVHEAQQMLFITSRDTNTLIKFNPVTNQPVAVAATGVEPWDVVIHEGLNEVYVSNFASGDVWVYDANTMAVKKKISVGAEATLMEIFPDINTVAVVVRKLQSVAIIQNGNVVQYVPSGGTGPFGLASDQVNKQLIVANRDTGNAWIIYKDGGSWRLDERSQMKDFGNTERTVPFEVAYNSNNNRIYITYMMPNGKWYVDVIEKRSRTQLVTLASIRVGNSGSDRDPNVGGTGLAINPVTNNLFVADTAAGTVTVIGPDNKVKATVAVGVDPYEVAVNITTQTVYVTLRAVNNLAKIDDGF